MDLELPMKDDYSAFITGLVRCLNSVQAQLKKYLLVSRCSCVILDFALKTRYAYDAARLGQLAS